MRKIFRGIIEKIVRVIIQYRRKINKNRKLLFYGLNPMNYTMFRPIQKIIEQISKTEIYFCFKDVEKQYNEYIKLGVPENKILSINRARLNIWDAIIMADFIKPRYLFPGKLINICHGVAAKKWSYVNDFGNLVTDDYKYNYTLKDYDIVHYHNEIVFQNAKKRGLFKEENSGKVVGMCVLDELVQNMKPDCIENIKKKYVPNEYYKTKIILYAPTWGNASSYSRRGKEILEALSSVDAFVIVKPHPLCIINNVGETGLTLSAFMKKIFKNKNYIIITDTPYEVMAIADMLISDFGSIVFEFTLMKKPIYLFESNDIFEQIADMEQYDILKKCCHIFTEKDNINNSTFNNFTTEKDKYYYMDLVQNMYFSNVGFASEVAVKNFLDRDIIIRNKY